MGSRVIRQIFGKYNFKSLENTAYSFCKQFLIFFRCLKIKQKKVVLTVLVQLVHSKLSCLGVNVISPEHVIVKATDKQHIIDWCLGWLHHQICKKLNRKQRLERLKQKKIKYVQKDINIPGVSASITKRRRQNKCTANNYTT